MFCITGGCLCTLHLQSKIYVIKGYSGSFTSAGRKCDVITLKPCSSMYLTLRSVIHVFVKLSFSDNGYVLKYKVN